MPYQRSTLADAQDIGCSHALANDRKLIGDDAGKREDQQMMTNGEEEISCREIGHGIPPCRSYA